MPEPCSRRRGRRPGVGLVRGGVGAAAYARRVAAAAAARARRPAHRAPVGLPPRAALARDACGRTGGRVGARARAGARRRHGRPRLAAARRADAARAAGAARHAVRRARQPRRRATAATRSRARRPDRRSRRRICSSTRRETVELRGKRVQLVGVDPRAYRPASVEAVAARRRRRPTYGSCCATSPYVLDFLPVGAFDLVLAGSHARRPDLAAARSDAQVPLRASATRATPPGSTGGRRRRCTSRPGLGTTFVPFRFFARPEATELVLQTGR